MKRREEHAAVLEFALDAGELLLENGAEIDRVEETMSRICRHYGVKSANFFVLSNGIFLSAGSEEEPLFAKVKHMPVRGGRLDWVCAVNQLSREIESGKYRLEEAQEALKQIRQMPGKHIWTQVLAGGISAGCFNYMFGGVWSDSLVACLTGILVQLFMIDLCGRYLSRIVGTIAGGAFITLLCIVLYRLGLGRDLNTLVISNVMLLVPGLAFVNGIRDLANGDYLSGAVRLLDAILRFACIAIGVGVLFLLYRRIFGGAIL